MTFVRIRHTGTYHLWTMVCGFGVFALVEVTARVLGVK